tara:strand:+ start:284 stop:463 length:180 start_codon:yes stop_codon:yes gene_type:complete
MYSKTFKIEQLKDGNWVGIGASFSDEFTGLTENQTQDVIDYLSITGISTNNLRATEETS